MTGIVNLNFALVNLHFQKCPPDFAFPQTIQGKAGLPLTALKNFQHMGMSAPGTSEHIQMAAPRKITISSGPPTTGRLHVYTY